MSSRIRDALKQGKVTLQLDFKPAVVRELFDKRLQRELADHNNQEFGKSLGKLLPHVHNLFFAGEIIDLDGPTGGFNLQVCWSTGYLAGINALKK